MNELFCMRKNQVVKNHLTVKYPLMNILDILGGFLFSFWVDTTHYGIIRNRETGLRRSNAASCLLGI
jgi:hypothetical protein